MIDEYIAKVNKAIYEATVDTKTKLTEDIFKLPGMSSRENRILLNELVKDTDKYLEIGVHRGSTFVSAMYKNGAKGVAIDNFSQFGTADENKKWFDQYCNEHDVKDFSFINNDCFNLTESEKELVKDCNIYFYDGDHRFEDQERAVTYYFNLLANPFILIVDDYNHGPCVEGTKKGFELTNAVVHKEWVLNGNTVANENHTFNARGWHNGLYIAVVGKP